VSRISVIRKLQQINVNKSSGPFDPQQKITPLTDIINTSFREKRFANIWKAYNTCPIPKINPCILTENIKPTAITSIFSKIQESCALLEWMFEDANGHHYWPYYTCSMFGIWPWRTLIYFSIY
jgi:hypothetical protein